MVNTKKGYGSRLEVMRDALCRETVARYPRERLHRMAMFPIVVVNTAAALSKLLNATQHLETVPGDVQAAIDYLKSEICDAYREAFGVPYGGFEE